MQLKFKYKDLKIQKATYSGKKKRHTLKFEVIIDATGKILNISKCFNGKTHDFSIRKSSEHVPRHVEMLADSGYYGLVKLHSNSTLPYKRPKCGTLTGEQKIHNRVLASRRIAIDCNLEKIQDFRISLP